ncbi:Cyclin-dependent kinase-like 4 [Colletotrichum siamense]|uniref:Cyclin-dependent kinase-like 4 n=1 Tax=Colletotrichum siamense TaxID=690259 RepID=A0A9P5F147_COLSI|nr:Cyclin-dependent kinase-like 4 [Colletotrichum siamense]KAF4865094.1 Cyclin-dependent kinase-like 4 [Colletotrichum siamense]
MNLQARIRGSWVKAADQVGKKFVPNDAIEQLASRQVVQDHLDANSQHLQGVSVGTLVAYIINPANPAKRLFLALVFSGCLQYLDLLRQSGFCDINLPIDMEYDEANGRYDVYTKDATQAQGSRRDLWNVFHQWTDCSHVESFQEKQWYFMAPVFVSGVFDYTLAPNCPLPLIYKPKAGGKVGLSGVVLGVRIHEAHIKREYGGQQIAFKEMHPNTDEYYAQEAKALRIIHGLKHPRLIKPLATFTRGEQAGFFFPWASGGNLEEHWKRQDPPAGDAGIRWVLDQLCGLCDATEALHQENCRHTDLKPQNILLFQEGEPLGTLRIADVGLAKIHTDQTAQRQRLDIITSAKTGSKRYEAPELQPPVEQLSRVFDVWCLGCVFLEFLVWTVYGKGGLADFWQKGLPHFWERIGNKYHQHWKAKDQISTMRATLSSGGIKNALLDCLELVAKGMLEPDYRHRMDATETRLELQRIRDKGFRDNGYLRVSPGLDYTMRRS